MLKGYFDRLYVPGVAFDISYPANVRPLLTSMRRIVGITTYGRSWWTALYVGDPPRKMVMGYLPRLAGGWTKVTFHTLYHINVASEVKRRAFIDHVKEQLGRI
jgi:putative NADPH-quinone reductase